MQKTGELSWHNADLTQARGILTRNKISTKLFTEALKRWADPDFGGGPHIYLIDTLTNKGARVSLEWDQTEYNVKVSSRPAGEFFDDLASQMPALLDDIVIMG